MAGDRRVSALVVAVALLGMAGSRDAFAADGGQVILTNAAQVRALTQEKALQHLPVRLRGVVLDGSSAGGRAIVVADDTAGMYMLATNYLFGSSRRGDLIEVEGVTDPGEFAPIVLVQQSKKLGRGTNPPAKPVIYSDLVTGAMDAQWVEFAGVVRRVVEPTPESRAWQISVASGGGTVSARASGPRDPRIQVDAEVRVQAICLYQFNQKRQVLIPILTVPAGVAMVVENDAPDAPFELPVRPAENLLMFSPETAPGHRVHVRGVVTHAQVGSLVWLRDASSGLRVQTAQNEKLSPGDEIDVLGFTSYSRSPAVLEDAVFRKIQSLSPPLPILLTNASDAVDHEDDLIAIEAQLTEIQSVLEGQAFTFDAGGNRFNGILKLGGARRAAPEWQVGAKVRVAGICSVIQTDPQPRTGVLRPGIFRPQAFQLLIRSPADIVVLQSPGWWTPKHVIYVLGYLTSALLVAIGVVTMFSRHRLKEQARRRAMAEAEFTAILAERNRVAREIHDTLAQGLAATSVQLRLAKKLAANDPQSMSRHLDTAQQLVGDSLEEARNSIWNMRSQVLETGDLPGALDGILKQMADGSELETSLEITGRQRRLAPVIENNLLRAGQEAITNAVRHARASRLAVTLDFGEKNFLLRVRDDGQGFDAAQPPKSNGGFGLVGMRERAAELKAELKIQSQPGQGTEIVLSVPLTGE